jgi:hypothetical protein
MPLKMRPTGLGHGVYKDVPDYGICRGEWCIERIYETRAGPAELRWFWALHVPSKPGTMRSSNQVASLEIAKGEFEASWEQWQAWAGGGGVSLTSRAQFGPSFVDRFSGDPFGIGYFEVRVVQLQLVR